MTKNRERLLTFAAIAAIAIFAGDRLILSPLIRAWKDRTKRIADLTKEVNRGALLLDREQTIRDRWEMMRTNALPSSESVAEGAVMDSAARWQEASGIGFSSRKSQENRSDDEDFRTLEFRVDASGNIGAVKRFLYELEKDPLALKVEDLELASRDSEGRELVLGIRFSGLLFSRGEQ
ncbi:MAG: hypothetical protein FJ403_04560 [Verrucomicrobia bacterium]|nr:hypothetical protein [Verrucomicrobiota bacterium]